MLREYSTEERLQQSPRPDLWANVPDEQWNDWRWQMANRLNSVADFSRSINLTLDQIESLTMG